ncbi:hypothetical protein H0H93_006715 [Arthromyces matolae]|nr:hypothetical protein H0H93_006715 [Arthromyces matolae]
MADPPSKKRKTVNNENVPPVPKLPGTPAAVRTARRNALLTEKAERAAAIGIPGAPVNLPDPSSLPKLGKGGPKRNIQGELGYSFENRTAFLTNMDLFEKVPKKAIAPNTQLKYDRAQRLWLGYYAFERGEDEALKTLAKDAPFPPIKSVLQFINFAATRGQSHMRKSNNPDQPVTKGWSYNHTLTFIDSIHRMRERNGATPATRDERAAILRAVHEWATDLKILHTGAWEKRGVLEEDFEEFQSACLHPSVKINSNFSRLQLMLFSAFLYQQGLRPGCLIEIEGYRHSGEHMKWGDTEWVVLGHEPEMGLMIGSSWNLRLMKNMRQDDSRFVRTSMHNLSKSRIHMDASLLAEAFAIKYDVFEEDIRALRAMDPAQIQFPMRLTIRPSAKTIPVFHMADEQQPASLGSMRSLLSKVILNSLCKTLASCLLKNA